MEAREVTWGGVYKSYFISFVSATVVFMVAFLLSAVVASIFAPVSESNAQTVTVENRATGYFVSVTSPDMVELSVDATPTGSTAVSDASTVHVVTNAPSGYKLYLSTEENELKSSDTSISQTFKPVTSTSLTTNTWGYSLDSNVSKSWSAVPALNTTSAIKRDYENSADLISSSTTPNYPTGTDIPVYYGINADTTMPSGTYTTTVTYTAFAEGIYTYPTMQDFTTTDCKNLTLEQSYTLVDIRDGKEYKVARLKDGNCWMQQNLALDGGRILTPADSNVATRVELPENITPGTTSTNTEMQIAPEYPGYDGNYYNWCAAVAISNCAGIEDAQYTSVCPKGWFLPGATGGYSYNNLLTQYGLGNIWVYGADKVSSALSIVETSPLFFKSPGTYYNKYSISTTGKSAFYSTNMPSSNRPPVNIDGFRWSYVTGSSGSYILYRNGSGKECGFSVRCVLPTS